MAWYGSTSHRLTYLPRPGHDLPALRPLLRPQMRAEHKAQLAAAGLDDSDEDEDYPAYLPPW